MTPLPARALALLIPAALALTACTTGPTDTTSAPATPGGASTSAATDAFPVTIPHVFGSTTIPAEPKRVATLGWTDHETLASLGVVPVGAVKITWGGNAQGSTDWFDAQVATLGGPAPTRYADADGAPLTQIATLKPDLILATNSGLTKAEYDKLSRIAPVVAYPKVPYGTPWDESVRLVGKAIGRSAAAADVEAATRATITQAVAKYPQIKGKKAAWLWFAPADYSKFGFYTSTDLRPRMLTEFGFEEAPFVTRMSKGAPNQFSIEVSAEKGREVDADVVAFYLDEKISVAGVTGAKLINQIPAIASGAFAATADNSLSLPMSSPSPLSIPVATQKYLPLLAKAADKAR